MVWAWLGYRTIYGSGASLCPLSSNIQSKLHFVNNMFLGQRKLDLVMLWPTEVRWKKYGHARQSALKTLPALAGPYCAGFLRANSIFNIAEKSCGSKEAWFCGLILIRNPCSIILSILSFKLTDHYWRGGSIVSFQLQSTPGNFFGRNSMYAYIWLAML